MIQMLRYRLQNVKEDSPAATRPLTKTAIMVEVRMVKKILLWIIGMGIDSVKQM